MPNDLGKFYEGIRGAEFLFEGDTKDFVHEIGVKALKAMMARVRLDRQPDHPKAAKLIDEEEDILEFLRAEASKLERMFSRYLDMARIGLR